MIDETDRQILQILQQNGRTSNAEIARRIGLASSAVFQRIRKLEERGIIQGYTAQLNSAALGYGLTAFVMVGTSEHSRSADHTAGLLSDIPHVQEVHRVVGEDCFFVKVKVRDTDGLAQLLDSQIQALPAVASTKTTIVLTTAKDSTALPLEPEFQRAQAS